MQMLDHPNIVALKHHFFSSTDKEEVYLNLVLEYVPESVSRVAKNYNRIHQRMPLLYVKLYTYQVSQSPLLNYESMLVMGLALYFGTSPSPKLPSLSKRVAGEYFLYLRIVYTTGNITNDLIYSTEIHLLCCSIPFNIFAADLQGTCIHTQLHWYLSS